MVDINLFKDEEENEWTPNPDEGEGNGDKLKDDLVFGDEISESTLDDEALFGDEEDSIPDLEESEEVFKGEDEYNYGEAREKKSSFLLWAALFVVLIGVGFVLYQFVIEPRLRGPEIKEASTPLRPEALKSGTGEPGEVAVSREDTSTGGGKLVGPGTKITDQISTLLPMIENSKNVFNALTQTGQFESVMISGNKFHVGYVSETPNVAESMEHKIKTLLNVSSVIVSPEDGHRTAGKMYYHGVVSGQLSYPAKSVTPASANQFNTIEAFEGAIKVLVQRNGLTVKEIQKLSEDVEEGRKETEIRVKIQGEKERVLAFLDAFKQFRGNFVLNELFIVPVTILDFQANETKLVLLFLVSIG